MKCSKHHNRDIVANCVDCGRGLCSECADKFSEPLCSRCASNRINENKTSLITSSVIMIVLFIIGFVFDENQGFFHRIAAAYILAGIPWGWSAITSMSSNDDSTFYKFWFLVPDSEFWGYLLIAKPLLFICKCIFSLLIGAFITPFKIYKIVRGLSDAKSLEEHTDDSLS